jgi:hypothetical protein
LKIYKLAFAFACARLAVQTGTDPDRWMKAFGQLANKAMTAIDAAAKDGVI